MAEATRKFIPAASYDWLLPLYDPIQKLLGAESARRQLVEQAALTRGQRVLEIGCGTGSLLIAIKELHPEVEVVGLDPDRKALERARRKARRAAVPVQLDQGFSDALPYEARSFDRVFSSFMLHHLGHDEKERTLREIRRVLKPHGSVHVLDFGGTDPHAGGWLTRWFHAHEQLRENYEGRIPELMRAAGLEGADEIAHRGTWFGRLAYYRAAAG